MKKIIINENMRGFLFKNGKYIKTLGAGRYMLFGSDSVELSELGQPISCKKCSLETLLADKEVADKVAVVEVGDEELALHYVNGRFSSVLTEGKHAFWAVTDRHEFKTVDISEPTVDGSVPEYIFQKIPNTLYTRIEVAEFQ